MTPQATLRILTHDRLHPLRHGFFTRHGGASSGIFSGLNCGTGSSDLSEAVEINRARAADALGLGPGQLVSVHQVHSPDVWLVELAPDPGAPTRPPRADAMVTATPGLALAVLTADCAPVLLADPGAGVIGAAHAGWRGALDGIIGETVAAMERLGAGRADIRAVIGPTISQPNYEVGPEFVERFLDADRDHGRYFAGAGGAGHRAHFDLPGFVLGQLRAAGVEQGAWIGRCTYREPDCFYSYRRSTHLGEVDYGRLISAIRL